jgi:hypothetical protein
LHPVGLSELAVERDAASVNVRALAVGGEMLQALPFFDEGELAGVVEVLKEIVAEAAGFGAGGLAIAFEGFSNEFFVAFGRFNVSDHVKDF